MENAVDDLNGALETGKAEILKKVDWIRLEKKKKGMTTTLEPTMRSKYIRFNSALNLKPAFLERDCMMLEVNQFLGQVFWYICSGGNLLKKVHSVAAWHVKAPFFLSVFIQKSFCMFIGTW